eukprot:11202220-Lingulodinium_polyedra.AAC.1
MEAFMMPVHRLTHFFIDKGGRRASVNWSMMGPLQVTYTGKRNTDLIEPEDELWDYTYYASTNGDTRT